MMVEINPVIRLTEKAFKKGKVSTLLFFVYPNNLKQSKSSNNKIKKTKYGFGVKIENR